MTTKKPQRRNSLQRERIFKIISESKGHPKALDVYEQLCKEKPSVSLGNLYRNMGILLEEGRIADRDVGDGNIRYDAIVGDHSHFVCERCGTVTDFDMPLHREITEEARRRTCHDIRSHTIQFHGVCRKCKALSKKS
ncbi:MAG: transcriptional repressor [Deltaproteobacteria bacterium]|nr:transcriptional repressor [Deltaproteobacteria bacterium]